MYKYIRAMSRTIKEVKDSIINASYQIDHHIIKLLLFPDSDNVDHWKQEIFNFIHDVDRLKNTNKWPRYNIILDFLSCHNDVLDNYRITVEDEYDGLIPHEVSNDMILSAVQEYQLFLAEKLSTDGLVRRADVYSVLDKIIAKYSS